MKHYTLLFLLLSATLLVAANDYTITFNQPQEKVFELKLDLQQYEITQKTIDGNTYSHIEFSSSVFTMEKGYAGLPVLSSAVQLPADKNMDIEITESSYQEIDLEYPLLPSRGVIYRNPDAIPYKIDPASVTDTWYPGALSVNGQPFIIRDVRGSRIEFYPFQYNALQQKLRIYNQLIIRLTENESIPVNPLTREPGQHLLETLGMYNSIFINSVDASRDLSMAQHGDILVITTARDESAIQPYIDWKREKGFNVNKQVVSGGSLVKDLIQQEYDANPNLLYVQLVGDWEDIQSEMGTGENQPMDPDMGCVSGTDNYQDIAVGRISATSAAEVTLQVNKILNYEKNPATGSNWLITATGIASTEGSTNGDDSETDYEHNDVIWNDKLDPFTFDYYNPIYDPSATSQDVTDAVNSGTGIINYTGHGSTTSWGTSGFNNNDVNNLTNGDMLPFIVSVACNNGEFDISGDCFAEAWLKKEGGGAVMMLAATISQPWAPPMRGQDYFMDVLIGGYDYDAHAGQSGINTNEQRTFVGSIIVNGLNLMLTESASTSDLETVQTWTTFGDPAMQIRTASPAALTVSNENIRTGEPFNTNITSAGSPVSGAMVTISQEGSYFTGVTDVNGDVTIEHSLNKGSAKLVVTSFNTETIYKDVTVSAADGPWITVETYILDDIASGNGNNLAENSETIQLDVTAANTGSDTAHAVIAKLRSTDIFISITDSTHDYGDIASSTSVIGNDAFTFTVADSIPDQHSVTCQVVFTDALSNTWNSNISILLNAPALNNLELTINDTAAGNGDSELDIGETADLLIPTFNEGHAAAASVQASLTSGNNYLTVNTGTLELGTLNANDTTQATFNVTAAAETPAGTQVQLFYSVTSGIYTHLDTFTVVIGDLPVVLMRDGSEYIDNIFFYDTGGADGEYSNREKLTMTFYPSTQGLVKAVFHSFTLSDLDKLSIYDGIDTNAPEVAGSPFSTTNSPGEIVATNGAGALTFYFESNVVYSEAGWQAQVFTTVVSDMETASQHNINSFELIGNYPNPFNPTTIINYELPITNYINITIYNALGQKVKTLVNWEQKAGQYSVSFDANGLSSGVYYYRLSTGNGFVQTRKMILMR